MNELKRFLASYDIVVMVADYTKGLGMLCKIVRSSVELKSVFIQDIFGEAWSRKMHSVGGIMLHPLKFNINEVPDRSPEVIYNLLDKWSRFKFTFNIISN